MNLLTPTLASACRLLYGGEYLEVMRLWPVPTGETLSVVFEDQDHVLDLLLQIRHLRARFVCRGWHLSRLASFDWAVSKS